MILYHLIKVSMSQFDRLPNDVIVYLAFDYDLPTIVAFCRSSKRFNKLICQNNNFWLSKIGRDYGLSRTDIPSQYDKRYREYYKDVTQWLQNDALTPDRLDLAKVGIYLGELSYFDLIEVLKKGYNDIAIYLIDNGIINSEMAATMVITKILDLIDKESDINKRVKLFELLYDNVLPAGYKYLKHPRYKKFWAVVISKLEDPEILQFPTIKDIYKRRFEEFNQMTG